MNTLKIEGQTSPPILRNAHPSPQAQRPVISETEMSSRVSMRRFRSETNALALKIRTQHSESNPVSCDSTEGDTEEVEEYLRFLSKMDHFLAASQMYEESGQLQLALEEVERALEYLDQMAQEDARRGLRACSLSADIIILPSAREASF
jgi:hypothetical protein